MSGAVVWITGLPAAGKSTLAGRARERLVAAGVHALVLDSDELRPVLAPGLGYAAPDRREFYRRVAALAVLLAGQGATVLVAATAPERRDRDAARAGGVRFVEVLVDTPRPVCEARDRKGLYRRARAGEAPDLPGAGAPYEPPLAPDLVAHGGHDDAAVARLVALVSRRDALPAGRSSMC